MSSHCVPCSTAGGQRAKGWGRPSRSALSMAGQSSPMWQQTPVPVTTTSRARSLTAAPVRSRVSTSGGNGGDSSRVFAPGPLPRLRWRFVTKTTVAIIGGGISGLSAAYALHKRQVPYLLLEAGPSLGGVIRTETRDGFLLEGGPDSMLAQKPEGIALCRELGLGERLVPTNPDLRSVYILHRRKLHPLPEGMMLAVPTKILPFARSGLFSWPGKLRMGLDLVIPGGNGRGRRVDRVLPAAPVRAGGGRAARRAAARRHPRRRPRAALDPRHLPALPRPRDEARQPRARDVGGAAAGAGAGGEAARRLLLAARGPARDGGRARGAPRARADLDEGRRPLGVEGRRGLRARRPGRRDGGRRAGDRGGAGAEGRPGPRGAGARGGPRARSDPVRVLGHRPPRLPPRGRRPPARRLRHGRPADGGDPHDGAELRLDEVPAPGARGPRAAARASSGACATRR